MKLLDGLMLGISVNRVQLIMLGRYQKYMKPFLKNGVNCIAVAFLQLVSFDVFAGGRLESIADGMVAATVGSANDLRMLGIYGSAVLVLLVLLNFVREKKGKKRVVALLAIQLLCNAVLIYSIT